MSYEYMIGPTEEDMELLPDLGMRTSNMPRPGFRPYSTAVELGDGNLQGHGFPVVTWHWSYVSIAEREIFIDLLDPGALSGDVFIRTRKTDNTWATYECKMKLPTGEEDAQSGSVLNFDIEFTHCVFIADP